MTARQEKVREALRHSGQAGLEREADAALAEVEEWEARLAALVTERDEALAAQRLVVDRWERGKEALRARAEAAEAEADKLKAALRASWPGISGESYERPITEVHALVTAALAPADRDTA